MDITCLGIGTSVPAVHCPQKVLKNSLAVDRRTSYESKEAMIQHIKEALQTLSPADVDKVNEFPPISNRQVIITINDADVRRTEILIDKFTILINGDPHFGKEASVTNV